MTAFTLVAGTLFRRSEVKTSANGRRYVRATIRVGTGDEVLWWTVLAFDDVIIDEIAALDQGAPVAVVGPMTAGIYTNERGARVSLSLVAQRLLTLGRRRRTEAVEVPAGRPFDDKVPF
jgi:hypothetical protein